MEGSRIANYTATINWKRKGAIFTDNRYSRAHQWSFDGGVVVPASSSPHVVRPPYANPDNVDPEEAFVASLSSCHMLSLLWEAAKRGFVIDTYYDEASGVLERNEAGREAMTRVVLRPHLVFSGNKTPSEADVAELHHLAHEGCYIANSVKTDVVTEGTWEFVSSDVEQAAL